MSYTWSLCKDDQDAETCAYICSAEYDYMPEEWRRQACKWQDADSIGNWNIHWDNCKVQGDADWCAYSCNYLTDCGCSYGEDELTYACDNDDWIEEGET